MMELKKSELQKALSLLGGRLRVKEADSVRLVVCGGAAFIALDPASGSTVDVDVLAMYKELGYNDVAERL